MRSWLWWVAPLLVACGGQGMNGVIGDAEDADSTSGETTIGANPDAVVERELSETELRATWQELALPGVGDVQAIARVPAGLLVAGGLWLQP